jgi:hypothetical protein
VSDDEKAFKLLAFAQAWIADQRIRCAETIYQMDHVAENSPEFIEGVCDIAGYANTD